MFDPRRILAILSLSLLALGGCKEDPSTSSTKSTLAELELGDEAPSFVRGVAGLVPAERARAIEARLLERASAKRFPVHTFGSIGKEPPRTARELALALSLPGPAVSTDFPTSDLELTLLFLALARRHKLDAWAMTQPEESTPGIGRGAVIAGVTIGGETVRIPLGSEAPGLVDFERVSDEELEALVWIDRARSQLEMRASKRARKEALRATELAPGLAAGWTTLSRARTIAGLPSGALDAFERALDARSTRAMKAHHATLVAAAGDHEKARALVDRLFEAAPEDPDVLRASGLVACAAKDTARAADALEAAARATSGSWEAWRDAAVGALVAGQPERARDLVRQGRRLADRPEVWDDLMRAADSPRAKWSTRLDFQTQSLGACATEAKPPK